MAAPLGNQNAAKGKIVTDAIRKALANDDYARLRDGCEKIAEAFAKGEAWAVQFVADRLDGKPAQSLEHSGKDGAPLPSAVQVTLVRPEEPHGDTAGK